MFDIPFLYIYFQHIEYYLFRSMFSTKDINNPKVWHIGAQFTEVNNQFVIREVVNGYPADKAGLLRGDIIETASGEAFDPYFSFNSNNSQKN